MYKDIYKRANDKIPTDDAYERVMKSIQKKKQHRPYAGVTRAAALAACFVVAFTAVGIVNRHEQSMKKPQSLAEEMLSVANTAAPKADIETEAAQPEAQEAKQPEATPRPTAAPRADKPTITPESETVQTEKADKVSEYTAIPAHAVESAETDAEAADKSVEIKMNVLESEPAQAASGGGGGSSSRAMSFDALVEVSLDEYSEYLGVDVAEKAEIPEGFVNKTPETAHLEVDGEGGYITDSWTFVFENGDSRILIETTRDTSEAMAVLNNAEYEKSTALGVDAVVINEGDLTLAHMINAEVAYKVSAVSVEDTAFETLLTSLAK